jgi:hypothetical protein
MMTTPSTRQVNIVTGTHSRLCFTFLGAGGVYREPFEGRRVGGADAFADDFLVDATAARLANRRVDPGGGPVACER